TGTRDRGARKAGRRRDQCPPKGTTMVELTAGRLRWVPAAASARQPEAVVSVMAKLLAVVSEPKSGVRASITTRWPISIFIATHLQLHLAAMRLARLPENFHTLVGKRVGLAVPRRKNARRNRNFREPCHVCRRHASS